jgi:hypothetical protein
VRALSPPPAAYGQPFFSSWTHLGFLIPQVELQKGPWLMDSAPLHLQLPLKGHLVCLFFLLPSTISSPRIQDGSLREQTGAVHLPHQCTHTQGRKGS